MRKSALRWWCLVGSAAVLMHALPGAGSKLQGQEPDRWDADPARTWFATTYDHLGVPVEPSELDRLARSWSLSTDPDRPLVERQASFRALLDVMIQVQDVPAGRYSEPALVSMTSRVASLEGLEAPPPLVPDTTSGWNEPGAVDVRGEGPVPLVLLSDIDYDGSIYHDFADLFGDLFTMHVITLPGAGGTLPPPLPEQGRPSERAWWANAAETVLSLMEEYELDRPVVVGSLNSAYLAARLAIDHPERFRAAVLLNGRVRPGLPIPGVTGTPTPEEREAWVDGTLPNLFPVLSPDSVRQTYLARSATSAIDSTQAEYLSRRAARSHPSVVSRYATELLSTDLTDPFAELRVPTLVIPSLHDERSPIATSEMGASQWERLKLDHPHAPLTVVSFRATRNYASVDSPLELGRAIEDFLAGRPVRAKPRDPALTAYRPSPRSAVTQVVGATEIEIEYSSPAARDRTVWGGVVPWGSVWQSGANAATRIRFSRDVTLEGRPVDAGAYAFFLIPREQGTWTVILSRPNVQFGTLNYDPDYDALRLEVDPEEADYSEHLRYSITPRSPVDGRLEVTWAGRRVNLDVRASEGTGMRRVAATPFRRLDRLGWTSLAVDNAGDALAPAAPDGTGLSYYHDTVGDTLWFRFDLEGRPSIPGLGLNVAVDTDMDQATGAAWWGGNNEFRYDRVVTVWVVPGIEDEFWGTIGISEPDAVAQGDYSALGSENVAFAVSEDRATMMVGVPVRDLDADGHMRLIGTVGTNVFWTDELVDQGSVRLELSRPRQ